MNSNGATRHNLLTIMLLLGLLNSFGCGPGRTGIEGTVTVDGVSVDEGLISFVPAKYNGKPVATAKIVDGRFAFAASEGPLVGRNSVVITGGRRTGRQVVTLPDEFNPQGETVNEVEELVPAKFREVNTLVIEITSNGQPIELILDAE